MQLITYKCSAGAKWNSPPAPSLKTREGEYTARQCLLLARLLPSPVLGEGRVRWLFLSERYAFARNNSSLCAII